MTKKAPKNDALAIDMTAANQLPARGEELMRIVTRFEYALKEIGYGRAGRNGEVEVNWDAFANDRLKAAFLKKVCEQNIAPTILAKPPKQQILKDGVLGWEEKAPPTNIQDFVGAVRRVRNNLIHGGKSGDPDADRNTKLVAEAIEVLLEALRTDADLRQRFENRW